MAAVHVLSDIDSKVLVRRVGLIRPTSVASGGSTRTGWGVPGHCRPSRVFPSGVLVVLNDPILLLVDIVPFLMPLLRQVVFLLHELHVGFSLVELLNGLCLCVTKFLELLCRMIPLSRDYLVLS